MAGIHHPGVVKIFSIGSHEGTPYLVMERVRGISLRDWMKAPGRPLPERVRMLEKILEVIAFLHGRGVLHRDLKPENILVREAPSGGEEAPVLIDFGLVRMEQSATITRQGTILGSPVYLCPEQLEGEPVRASSDLWAAGVMLYETVTGSLPFTGP